MTKAESTFRTLAKHINTPYRIQRLLRNLPYNHEEKSETLRSALSAWQRQEAHCLEAAFLAAAVLEQRGYPPLVLSFESQDKLDHVLYVFREKTGWGAVARSRDEGLHGRPPRFRSLRALAQSYVDPYVDLTGRITGFALAHLDQTGARWRDSPRNVWKAERYLIALSHRALPTSDRRYASLLNRYRRKGPLPRRSHWW